MMSVTEEVCSHSHVCCANQTLQIIFWVGEKTLKEEQGIIGLYNRSGGRPFVNRFTLLGFVNVS